MKSRLKILYFSGSSAAKDFNKWSEDNLEVDIKDLQMRSITEGCNDGHLSIILVHEVENKILTFPGANT